MRLHRSRAAVALAGLGLLATLPSCALMASDGPSAGPAHAVPTPAPGPLSGSVPRPHHLVLVVLENERASEIIGSRDAPYINSLSHGGATFTESFGVAHPSQPNYITLFSGSAQGVHDDSCGPTFGADNQAHQLIAAGFSFRSYAEGLPAPGSKVCASGRYARKHAPWTNFTNVPASAQLPFTSFPRDYSKLPDVSWVIPDLCHDMHDCSVASGDSWLKAELGGYARWAKDHSSLLVVTFDEDDYSGDNRIATIFYGGDVRPGRYDEHITHLNVLATIESMYGLPRLGGARSVNAIGDIWK